MARAKSTLRSRKLHGDSLNTPSSSKRGPKVGAATDEPIVLDNLPELIPVTVPELAVIETYLSTLIDRLLADATPASPVKPILAANPGKPIRLSRPRS